MGEHVIDLSRGQIARECPPAALRASRSGHPECPPGQPRAPRSGHPRLEPHADSSLQWSGKRDSNPRPPAWKAGALPLSYSRPYRWWGGEDLNPRRRTPADLQSAPFGHLGTSPNLPACDENLLLAKRGTKAGAGGRICTPDPLLTKQLLFPSATPARTQLQLSVETSISQVFDDVGGPPHSREPRWRRLHSASRRRRPSESSAWRRTPGRREVGALHPHCLAPSIPGRASPPPKAPPHRWLTR